MAMPLPISTAKAEIVARVEAAINAAKQHGKYGHYVIDIRFADGEVHEVKTEDKTQLKFTPKG